MFSETLVSTHDYQTTRNTYFMDGNARKKNSVPEYFDLAGVKQEWINSDQAGELFCFSTCEAGFVSETCIISIHLPRQKGRGPS
jgi:hypothetical protein